MVLAGGATFGVWVTTATGGGVCTTTGGGVTITGAGIGSVIMTAGATTAG